MFTSNCELINQSYSDKLSHERIISSISNQKLNTLKEYTNRGFNVQTENVKDVILIKDKISSKHLINGVRGNNLIDHTDQNSEQINESLKESVRLGKLQKNFYKHFKVMCNGTLDFDKLLKIQ